MTHEWYEWINTSPKSQPLASFADRMGGNLTCNSGLLPCFHCNPQTVVIAPSLAVASSGHINVMWSPQ
jgi:hypothetical protein